MPHAMSNQFLPEFNLQPDEYGWTGRFPGGPHCLFGKEISLEIHTRSLRTRPKVLPPVSASQAALVSAITPELPTILKRVEEELTAYNRKYDAGFKEFVRDPHVWLSCESEDGTSWTFVVERIDSPDFGYHAEFKGTKFIELWAGD